MRSKDLEKKNFGENWMKSMNASVKIPQKTYNVHITCAKTVGNNFTFFVCTAYTHLDNKAFGISGAWSVSVFVQMWEHFKLHGFKFAKILSL